METSEESQGGCALITSSSMIMVPRHIAEKNGVIPTTEQIERAKERFVSAGLPGAKLLIEALQMLENDTRIVGYFGFTIDRVGRIR